MTSILKATWPIIVIVILLATVFFLIRGIKNVNEKASRELANVVQLLEKTESTYLELFDRQSKEIALLKDTLTTAFMAAERLKPRQILKTINSKYEYSYDTTITLIKNPVDTTSKTFTHTYDPCITVGGEVFWTQNKIKFNNDLNIDITIIDYWDRKRRWLWIFSRKIYYRNTINNCTGDSESTEINFIKWKKDQQRR